MELSYLKTLFFSLPRKQERTRKTQGKYIYTKIGIVFIQKELQHKFVQVPLEHKYIVGSSMDAIVLIKHLCITLSGNVQLFPFHVLAPRFFFSFLGFLKHRNVISLRRNFTRDLSIHSTFTLILVAIAITSILWRPVVLKL